MEQPSDLHFRIFTAISDNKSQEEVELWLNEYYEEGIDYSFGSCGNTLHVYEYNIHFHNDAAAVAFKLRWME